MKNTRALFAFACLAVAALAQSQSTGLPEFPGAEFKDRTLRRSMRAVTDEDLTEGSPVWIAYRVIEYSKAMDFVSLEAIQSPAALKNAKSNTRADVDALIGGFLLDKSVKIGDSKEDGHRCYVYLTFTREDGRKRSFYEYFLKLDGKWVSVTPLEWQRGALEP
jgi:hypothetical protein